MCELRKMLVYMADFFNYTLRCMCYYQGVQLSPLGFAACQSKNCTNKEVCVLEISVQLRQLHSLGNLPPPLISLRF